MVELSQIIKYLEAFAPLNLQEDYDNSGLQIGFLTDRISRILLCLDVTEEIVDEAIEKDCQLIISHHPLIFKGLKVLSDKTYQQRCAVKALRNGIAIYSSHTCLDNVFEGVNYKIASIIGLSNCSPLLPCSDAHNGSGIIGELSQGICDTDFLALLKGKFGVEALRHSKTSGKMINKVALCGGSAAFLLPNAIASGADCYISGEFHYHDYFENSGLLLAELGHYQSEKFTIDLLFDLLSSELGNSASIIKTEISTNPIYYL